METAKPVIYKWRVFDWDTWRMVTAPSKTPEEAREKYGPLAASMSVSRFSGKNADVLDENENFNELYARHALKKTDEKDIRQYVLSCARRRKRSAVQSLHSGGKKDNQDRVLPAEREHEVEDSGTRKKSRRRGR